MVSVKVEQNANLFHGQQILRVFKENESVLQQTNMYLHKSLSHVIFAGFCLADPLPPAKFEVNKEKTTSTSLHVWWTPSSGKVTRYELELFDNSHKIQETQIQESTSWNEHTFFNLTAGNKYNIAITAVSGEKRSLTVYTNGSTGKTVYR